MRCTVSVWPVVLLGEGADLCALRRRHDVHVVPAGREPGRQALGEAWPNR